MLTATESSYKDEPQVSEKNLYFVNLGGYHKDKLYELHEFPGRASGYPTGSPTDPDERN